MARNPKIKRGKAIRLRDVPLDVQEIVMRRQKYEEDLCDCERAQERVVYKIIREHNATTSDGSTLFYKGHTVKVQPETRFENGEFVITLTVRAPLHTSLGMALNYERIGSKE
jgi:hypothetical protein